MVCTGVLQAEQAEIKVKTCPASCLLSANTPNTPLCILMPSLSSAPDHGLLHNLYPFRSEWSPALTGALPTPHRGVFAQLAERREGLLMGFADLGDELF